MLQKKLFLSLLLFLSPISALIETPVAFEALRDECFGTLREYGKYIEHTIANFPEPLVSFTEFNRALSEMLRSHLIQFETSPAINQDVAEEDPNAENYPFLRKVVVNPSSTLFVFGDVHGSVHSLIRNLDRIKDQGFFDNNFHLKENVYFFFLGDFTDRGRYGCETLYTISRFKEANPHQVFIGRGNHEDIDVNISYGFWNEISQKYGRNKDQIYLLIDPLYDTLPDGTFVGSGTENQTNYIFLCHALPAFGIDVHPLLNNNNHQNEISFMHLAFPQQIFEKQYKIFSLLKHYHKLHTLPPFQELTWGDISSLFEVSARGALAYPLRELKKLLEYYSDPESNNYVHAVFRGHQHTQGNGCFTQNFTHYENRGTPRPIEPYSISTIISAPEGVNLGGDSHDSFVSITTAEKFEDWRFTPHEYHVPSSLLLQGGKVSKIYDAKDQKFKFHWEIVIGKRDRC